MNKQEAKKINNAVDEMMKKRNKVNNFRGVIPQEDKEAQEHIETAIKKLKAKKEKKGYYNPSINYKGCKWVMVITTYDDKPFSEKRVDVEIFPPNSTSALDSKRVAMLDPEEAGYTPEEVEEHLEANGYTLPV